MFRKNSFLLFAFCFCFGNSLLGSDIKAQKALESAAEKSLKSSFTAEVEYPIGGNPANLEPTATFYFRPEDDNNALSTRLDLTYSSQSASPGEKMVLIDGKFGKFQLDPNANIKIQIEKFNLVPSQHIEFTNVFVARNVSNYSFGEKDVIYDGVPCYEIVMTPKEPQPPQGLGKVVYTIGKDNQFIYCVKPYFADGSEIDITQCLHTQFKNVQFTKLADEIFMPSPDMEIITANTSLDVLRYAAPLSGEKPLWLSVLRVVLSWPFIITIVGILILLLAWGVYLKFFRKR